MTWKGKFVDDFNYKESSGITNLIIPCLSKVGQNCFVTDTERFTAWLDSLDKNALYKSLLRAHTAIKLLYLYFTKSRRYCKIMCIAFLYGITVITITTKSCK